MARLIRRPQVRITRDIDSCQREALMLGVEFPGMAPFSGLIEMREVWERCRGKLLEKCSPFTRPDAYWVFDVPIELLGGVDPNCPRNGYESERSALVRLRLPLTERERQILAAESRECAGVCTVVALVAPEREQQQ